MRKKRIKECVAKAAVFVTTTAPMALLTGTAFAVDVTKMPTDIQGKIMKADAAANVAHTLVSYMESWSPMIVGGLGLTLVGYDFAKNRNLDRGIIGLIGVGILSLAFNYIFS